MLKVLSILCSTKKPASIYTNYQEMNKFHFGIILAVNEKNIAIQTISPDGEYDGVVAMSTENVIRIETDGQYSDKMSKLCSQTAIVPLNEVIDSGDIIKSMLHLAENKEEIISIELLDSGYNDIVGFVDAIDDSECKVKQIDEYGITDGFAYISINDITKISYSTQDEKRAMKLWKLNNRLG